MNIRKQTVSLNTTRQSSSGQTESNKNSTGIAAKSAKIRNRYHRNKTVRAISKPTHSINQYTGRSTVPSGGGHRRSKPLKRNLFQPITFCTSTISYAFTENRNLALPSPPVNSLTKLSIQVRTK
jgi:hypothetical protein